MAPGLPRAPVWLRAASAVNRRLPFGRYRMARYLARWPRRRFVTRLPRALGGYRFACDLDDAIAREACFTGHYEPQETSLVTRLLSPGATFVDVGANWGYFTLIAAHRVGGAGRVLSLEPDPRLYRTLIENLERNALGQVEAMASAAWSEAAALRLEGYRETDGNFGLSRIAGNGSSETRSFEIIADTLDRIFAERDLLAVDLLKIDIEGSEGFALKGLEQTLASGTVRHLLLELHPALLAEHTQTPASVVEPLERAGFRGYAVDRSPAATRAAAYGAVLPFERLLLPLDGRERDDQWPHQLWVAPNIDSPCNR